jgi:hypothetical protein
MYSSTYEQTRTIWMDGRSHPGPNAPHTWMGFSTGRWDGDMLIVDTTHLKQGWIRRNGIAMSDRATYTEYIVLNGEMMSHIGVLVDPVYLAEPLVKSEEFMRSPRDLPAQVWLWVCEPVVEIATQTPGDVPAYLPGEHPFKGEFETKHHLPEFAVRGGPETMYPEFAAPRPRVDGEEPAARPGSRKEMMLRALAIAVAMIVGTVGAAVTRAGAQQNQNFDAVRMTCSRSAATFPWWLVTGATRRYSPAPRACSLLTRSSRRSAASSSTRSRSCRTSRSAGS